MDPFLFRLLVGALVWFIFDKIIALLVKKPTPKEIFDIILLIAVVLYVFFGSFLPFK